MDINPPVPQHHWTKEDALRISKGDTVAYWSHAQQVFKGGVVEDVADNPNYLGRHAVTFEGLSEPVAIAMLDKSTLKPKKAEEPVPVQTGADGLGAQRANQIAGICAQLARIASYAGPLPVQTRQSLPKLVVELCQLVEKQTAQRYEAIIEQRITEAVEARVQKALASRKEELEAQYAVDSQEYLETLRALRDSIVEDLDQRLADHATDHGALDEDGVF